MRFLSNFECKIIFTRSVNFWHQQDSNSLFKGSIGHVTSWCKWPICTFKLDFVDRLCRLSSRLQLPWCHRCEEWYLKKE